MFLCSANKCVQDGHVEQVLGVFLVVVLGLVLVET
jgi:hypothetical protein